MNQKSHKSEQRNSSTPQKEVTKPTPQKKTSKTTATKKDTSKKKK